MKRTGSNTPKRIRKAAISAFILIHFWAVTIWIIPPYSEMIEKSTYADSPAGQFEQKLAALLTGADGEFGSILARNYVDLIGAHQYWDFFAPDAPLFHRYLSVCSDILESKGTTRIECINPLYQSFAGDLDHVTQSHHGDRSRSFRLVENLLRLKRMDLLNAFTRYWSQKKYPDESRTAFLLLHEFSLQPGRPEPESGSTRRDELIWFAPE